MDCEGVEGEVDLAVKELGFEDFHIVSRVVDRSDDGAFKYGTDILRRRDTGQVFYFKSERTASGFHRFEIVSKEKSNEDAKFQISILNSSRKPVLTFTSTSRPLNLEPWGDFSLWVPETSLAKVWQNEDGKTNQFHYEVGIQIA